MLLAVVVLIVVTEDTLEHGDGFSRFAVGNVGWTPGRVMCRLFVACRVGCVLAGFCRRGGTISSWTCVM